MRYDRRSLMRSPDELDLWLWFKGYEQWIHDPYSRTARVPHELDYLRGIHDHGTLRVLARWLSQKAGVKVGLRTMWQDKHIYVRPLGGPSRELADIAIILQRLERGGGVKRSMWLLQAKVVREPASVFRGDSSRKEIELLEGGLNGGNPAFEVLDRTRTYAIADPFRADAFHGPHFWSFLTLHRDPGIPITVTIRDRWPGSTTTAVPTHRSLCESLLGVISDQRGGEVKQPATDEWSRLYDLLMTQPSGVRTGHAVAAGNPQGAVMQLSTAQYVATALRRGSRPGHYPEDPTDRMWCSSYGSRADRTLGSLIDVLVEESSSGDAVPPGDDVALQFSEDGPGPGVPFTVFVDVAPMEG
jgi:hypothetical protein